MFQIIIVTIYGFLATGFILILPLVTELHGIHNIIMEKNSIESRTLVNHVEISDHTGITENILTLPV